MGFSLVMAALMEAKKPFIGHNCMYDWLYCYNQFVGELPPTYAEFIKEWYRLFPFTYDNKVLTQNSRHFFKTQLGLLYEKCTTDETYKSMLKFGFDVRNGCGNYNGTDLLSHYHEAAYDAYMTGLVFAMVLKRKELDTNKKQVQGGKGSHKKADKKGEAE